MNYYDILKGKRITGQFGEQRPGHKHAGDDLAMNIGDPIKAAIAGKIKGIYNDPEGYGNYAVIEDPETGLLTKYAHAQGFNVKAGQDISAGQIIGKAGSTGRSTGPHLHFEVSQNGKLINPSELANIMNKKFNLKALPAPIPSEDEAGQINIPDLRQKIIEKALNEVPVKDVQGGVQQIERPQDELTTLKNEFIKQNLQRLMQPVQEYQPTNAGDVVSAFQGGAGKGFGALSQFLSTSDGMRMLGDLFGHSGNSTFYVDANRQKGIEDQKRKQSLELEKIRQQSIPEMLNSLGNQELRGKELEETVRSHKAGEEQWSKEFGEKIRQFDIQSDHWAKEFGLESNKFDYQKTKDKIDQAFRQKVLTSEEHRFYSELNEAKRHNRVSEYLQDKGLNIEAGKATLPSEKQQEQLEGIKSTILDINDFEGKFDSLKDTAPEGILGRAAEPFKVAARAGNIKDTDETAFDAKRSLLFANIARNFGGEKGVLSDRDIQRIGQSLPSLSDSTDQKRAKMNEVKTLINNRLMAKGLNPIFDMKQKDPNKPNTAALRK